MSDEKREQVTICKIEICPVNGESKAILSDGSELVGLTKISAVAGVDRHSTVCLEAIIG